MIPDIYAAIRPVIETFLAQGIPYHIGGSVASSALGIARTTLDVDLVADIRSSQVDSIVDALSATYYIDADTILEAVEGRSWFNLVHLTTMIKVDVFIPKETAYGREAFSPRRQERFAGDDEEKIFLASPEDVVLHKLDWFKRGGEVSERQWNDLVGVLKVQAGNMDVVYLRRWADELGVDCWKEP